ncbi:MAG: sirohydrochlorin cobaltochelatase [Clostridia bacterium]|nr:sirohydrochlorin cobaltochelatase [Clostridia bacterium]
MTQKAILAVSFGTSFPDTLEKTIAAIEGDLAAAMPDRELRRAFTSGIIIRKLQKRDGVCIADVPHALEALKTEGFTDIVIQPTHMMNGDEYDKLRAQAEPFAADFARFVIGKPLLSAVEDYKSVALAALEELPEKREDTALVFMGHGTEHHANAAYAQLEYVFRDLERGDVLIGTVEGYPGLNEVLRRLGERPQIKRITLYPLMVVAGDHARNDLAGEEEDSWRSRLTALGYGVDCNLRGLGEYPGIRKLFTAHALAAEEESV